MNCNDNAFALVFYDGAYPLCNTERDVLRRWDRAHRLQLIDIVTLSFEENARPVGRNAKNAALHMRLPGGAWLTDMAAARHLYPVIGRGWMLAFTGRALLSHLGERADAWFAWRRLRVSLWLGMRRCLTDACCTSH